MRVLVCGDRKWEGCWKMADRLAMLPPGSIIIHGVARGADRMAGEIAVKQGFAVESYPADWRRAGRAAGPIRNRQMLDTKPDLVIAFHSNLAESKGTADCVREARRRGIPTEVIT